MNKKQLVVAWVMGILICLSLLLTPRKYTVKLGQGYQAWFDKPDYEESCPVLRTDLILPQVISILVIGSLLIYTLRDKKK